MTCRLQGAGEGGECLFGHMGRRLSAFVQAFPCWPGHSSGPRSLPWRMIPETLGAADIRLSNQQTGVRRGRSEAYFERFLEATVSPSWRTRQRGVIS